MVHCYCYTNREVAIGCGDELGVWETETGAQVKDFSSRITAPGSNNICYNCTCIQFSIIMIFTL